MQEEKKPLLDPINGPWPFPATDHSTHTPPATHGATGAAAVPPPPFAGNAAAFGETTNTDYAAE